MFRWFILQVYSGYEKKVKDQLLVQIDKKGLSNNINEMEVNYFFTNTPNRYGFIGGSPKTNTTFTMPDDRLSEIIKILKSDSSINN